MKNLGIYIHIPFCERKCLYCDFKSFTKGERERYFKNLKKEISMYSDFLKERKVDSIFIGGGTPSIVDSHYITEVISMIDKTKDCEVSIEVNPKSATYEKLCDYKRAGVTRLSIGMQSTNDSELLGLGRIHTYEEFLETYENAKKAGFTNINIDVMFGIPTQTVASFENTLYKVKNLNPTHISCYSLIIEEGTPFYDMDLPLPDEESERLMYSEAPLILSDYERYEISNFAKKGYECKHNLKYWNFEDYLGLGLGAHSFVENRRFMNVGTLEEYFEKTESDNYPVMMSEEEDNEELLKDFIITALRLKDGIDIKKINERFNIDFYGKYKDIIDKYVNGKFAVLNDDRFYLTPEGISVSNYIMSDFL